MILRSNMRWFLTAISFFTRIPIFVEKIGPEDLDRSLRFFPLVGLIVGGLGALVYYLSAYLWPSYISILLALSIPPLLTGALHEDGLTDFADGFGGGYTKEKILTIMKDSSIGTFGAGALIISSALKFGCYLAIPPKYIPLAFFCSHGFSRLSASFLNWKLNYARKQDNSIKQLGSRKTHIRDIPFQMAFGLIPFMLLPPYLGFVILGSTIIFLLGLQKYLKAKIGGYTGDCLGAAQQVTELIVLLSLSASLAA